jgi:hypothetical protein
MGFGGRGWKIPLRCKTIQSSLHGSDIRMLLVHIWASFHIFSIDHSLNTLRKLWSGLTALIDMLPNTNISNGAEMNGIGQDIC